jgi:hypothetical protein
VGGGEGEGLKNGRVEEWRSGGVEEWKIEDFRLKDWNNAPLAAVRTRSAR